MQEQGLGVRRLALTVPFLNGHPEPHCPVPFILHQPPIPGSLVLVVAWGLADSDGDTFRIDSACSQGADELPYCFASAYVDGRKAGRLHQHGRGFLNEGLCVKGANGR